MIIKNNSKITDGLYLLGPSLFQIFLLTDHHSALIDAGLCCLGRRYIKEVEEILGNSKPDFCLLTHVHWDHCGAVPVFKQFFPKLKVVSSQLGKEILERPRAKQLIQELNQAAGIEIWHQISGVNPNEEFEPFAIDQVLGDGDTVTLGAEVTFQAMATPGHTRDNLSYYVPEKKILFCSEVAGIPVTNDYILTESLVDFDQYINSLQRLANLEVEVLCFGHYGVYTGKDAKCYFPRALNYAYFFKNWVNRCLHEENKDIDRVVQRIKAKEYDPLPNPKQPEQAYILNLKAKISAVQRSSSN